MVFETEVSQFKVLTFFTAVPMRNTLNVYFLVSHHTNVENLAITELRPFVVIDFYNGFGRYNLSCSIATDLH